MKIIDVPQVGKLGLTVTYPGRYGLTRRQWVTPSNPRTPAQLNIRSNVTLLAAAWQALTDAKQDAWNTAASAVMSKPSLGQSGPLTGYQLYAKINATLEEFGQAMVDAPPARPAFPALAPTGLNITNNGGVIALKLACEGDTGDSTVVRFSKPQDHGTRVCRAFRMAGMAPEAAQGASDVTALFTGLYGIAPVGKRIFVLVQQMLDGWLGPEKVFSAVVPAQA